MKNNLTNEDLVGKYLDNEMSETDKLQFEHRLETDPQLKEEYNFQNDLVKGIKEHRRLELKARLSNIEVPSPFLHAIGLKIAAVTIATIIVGSGIYFALQDHPSEQISKIDVTSQQITIEGENILPKIPDIKIKPETSTKTEGKPAKRKRKKIEKGKKAVNQEQKATQPTVVKPDLAVNFEETTEESDNSGDADFNVTNNEIKEHSKNKMEVETIKDRRHKFHYKFYNNRLYLLGDFSKSPYEIIELNSKSDKKYFLYYQNSYYQLKTDRQKPTALQKIENDSIIEELKIIQKYK